MGGLKSTLSFYDDLPQGLFAVAPDGRIAHLNATLAHWLALRPEAEQDAVAGGYRVGGWRCADPCRRRAPAAPPGSTSISCARTVARFPRIWFAAAMGRAASSPCWCSIRATCSRDKGRNGAEAQLKRLFQSAPFGIATVGADGGITSSNAAFMRMFFVEGRDAPANITDLVPEADERVAAELGKALLRAYSGRAGATPVEVFFGPQGEFARRIYVSPLGTRQRGRGKAPSSM